MRILYTNFHQADGGGHTTYVLSLVGAAGRARHRGCRAGRQPPVSGSLGHAGRACRADGVQGGLLSAWPRIRRMRALLKIERFDLVHVNGAADHRLCMLASMGLRVGVRRSHAAHFAFRAQPGRGVAARHWPRIA